VETKAITEGAVMASLTAMLALAGIFIPVINPIVMLVWTLPVVVICIRHGMRAGTATIAVAGMIILMAASPVNAFNMLLCSVGPALFIGGGFYYKWSTEKAILYASVAAIVGLVVYLFISAEVMGVSVTQMFAIEPEVIDEMVDMISESGMMSSVYGSHDEMVEAIRGMFDSVYMMLPAALILYGLFTALTNYIVAYMVLRKLKEKVPPMTRLSTFRLPMPFLLGFIAGFGMLVMSATYWTDKPTLFAAGQNVFNVFLVLYAFQGFGLIFYYIGRLEPHRRGTYKFLLVFSIIISGFSLLMFISFAGVIDAFMDFRRLEFGSISNKRIL